MSVDPQTVRRRRFETAIDPIRGRPDPQRPARRVVRGPRRRLTPACLPSASVVHWSYGGFAL